MGKAPTKRLKPAKWLRVLMSVVLFFSWLEGFVFIPHQAHASASIVIDGIKDAYWNNVERLGESSTPGWEGFQLGEFRLTNDDTYLYYYVSAIHVPNWGDNGMYIDIALNINGQDSGVTDNPWSSQFNYSGMAFKPHFHIVQRLKGDAEVNGAAVYEAYNLETPLLATWDDPKGAQFAVHREHGFEGKVPLSILGLTEGDTIYAHVTLSGNENHHGAFDTIPQAPGNRLADAWDQTGPLVNVQSVYAEPYTVKGESHSLSVIHINPADGAVDVPVDLQRIAVQFNDTIQLTSNGTPSVTDAVYSTQVNGDTLEFILLDNLNHDHLYTVTIPAGSVEGNQFGLLEHPLVFQFKTEEDSMPIHTFRVHYYRYDLNPLAWDMWVWTDHQEGRAYEFDTMDGDGFAVGEIQLPASEINIITRPKNWSQQEVSRRVVMPVGQHEVDVWIIEGIADVYYKREDADHSPRIRAAHMDAMDTVYIVTTHEIHAPMVNDFELYNVTKGQLVPTQTVSTGSHQARLTIETPEAMEVRDIYEVRHPAFSPRRVTMRNVLSAPRFYYAGNDLGLSYSPDASTFKVWAPTATEVSLALYDDPGIYNEHGVVTDHSGGRELPMSREATGVWSIRLNEDLAGKYYMYKVEFADGTVHYAVDPYARAVAANGARTAIISLSETDPDDWDEDRKPSFIHPTDAIIYELHVRDFSINEHSGMTHKGKYLAFTESGLVDPDGNPLGIDHLVELGITHVHLLPVYDFKTINELTSDDPDSDDPKFNWGYDPQNYNVPEGSYSTDPTDPAVRITEFKQMVKALHDHGIRVIMDVVYNHTFEIEDGPFNKIVPGYFYRTDDVGIYTNGSGVGNEIASERPMVRKYIKDSVRYWAEEYHIDGFRFDLMGLIDTTTMTQIVEELQREVDPTLLFYGEPWTGGSSPLQELTLKGSQRGKNFAVFNDHFRTAIKGDSDGAGRGFATGAHGHEAGIVTGVRGAIDDFTDAPTETINYVTAHDNLNLWDKVIRTQGLDHELGFLNILDGRLIGGGSVEDAVAAAEPYKYVDPADVFANETVRRSLLANGIVMTAQGIPFIHAGDEILRTKYGDHNSYRSPDAVNQIRWQYKAEFKPVFDYYKGLIELRKSHPAFRMTSREAINQHLEIFHSHNNVVGFVLKNYANGDTWRNIAVIYNANTDPRPVTLPHVSGSWNVVVDDRRAGTDVIRTIHNDTVNVQGLSMMVLYDQAETIVPELTSIDLQSPAVAIEVGDEIVLHAIPLDQRGRAMSGQSITWTTSDPTVAVVNVSGKVQAIGPGEVIITATSGQVSAAVKLYVDQLEPSKLEIAGGDSLYETMSTTLTARVTDQYDQPLQNVIIHWSTSDESIATVDANGVVTGLKEGTVTITAQVPSSSLRAEHTIEIKPYVKRLIQIQYDRPDRNYSGWNLWVWNTGIHDGQIDFEKVVNGRAIAHVEIAPNVTNIGFIVRLNDWDAKDVEHDRFIHVEANDLLTKVIVHSNVSEFIQLPSVHGPQLENGNVTFYYRDPVLFGRSEMHFIERVKLRFDGQLYDMDYDHDREYFYVKIENLQEGIYEYSFLVTRDGIETEVTDPYNTKDGKSLLEYVKPNVQVEASVTPDAVDHTEHALLSVKITGDDVEIVRAYADLTALGGRSDYPIDLQLMAVSIAVRDDVTAGTKPIPVTVVDQYGHSHTTTVPIDVKTRIKEGPLDFDFDEARIYFILTDRFYNGDPSNDDPNGENYDTSHLETYHGGDLAGITAKLDYLQDLGINTIWITPIVDNVNHNVGHGQPWKYQYGYHGYWAKDFTKLDEHLGELSDLHKLIEQAHDRGIKIMVDVVLNHAGYGLKPDDRNVHGLPNFPTKEDRARFDGMIRTNPGNDDITGELFGLPDFITEDPAVRDQVILWQAEWLDRARTPRGDTIDYFRVDTIKHVDPTTLSAFKNELTKRKPDFKLLGESFGDSADNRFGFLQSGQMDSLLDFDFKWIALQFVNGDIDAVELILEQRNQKMDNTALAAQFLSSHDEDGFLSERIGGDESKLKVAAALQITAKGQPVIYYGEEIGRSGPNADFGQGIEAGNRSDMPWNQLEAKADLHEHYRKLLHIRAKHSEVFSKGTRSKVAGGDADGYLFFTREYEQDKVIVGLNTTNVEQKVTLNVPFAPGTEVMDEYGTTSYIVNANGEIELILPARNDGGTVILTEKRSETPGDTPPGETPGDTPPGETPGDTPPGETPGDTPPGETPGDTPPGEKPGDTPPRDAPRRSPGGIPGTGARMPWLPHQKVMDRPHVDVDGVLTVQMGESITEVLLHADDPAIDEAKALKLLTESAFAVEIPAGVIGSIRRPGTYISLGVSSLAAADKERMLEDLERREHARLTFASEVYQLTFGVRDRQRELEEMKTIDQPIQLIFPIAPEQDSELTQLYYLDENGRLNFVPSTRRDDRLIASVDHLGTFVIMVYDKRFEDVENGHWAESDIKRLSARQIVHGVSPSHFAPKQMVTRAEFTAMLARALGLKPAAETADSPTAAFTDVSEKDWFAEEVYTAAAAGIIAGHGDGQFAPWDPITREEMAALIVRAYEFKTGQSTSALQGNIQFQDQEEISGWAKNAVESAYALGFMIGREHHQFVPKGPATRAESSKVLSHLLQY